MPTQDTPRDPPTDPGLTPTPETPAQANQHIGSHGELILPDAVPIVDLKLATPFGLWLNRWWLRTHMLARGVLGTFSEYFIYFVGVSTAYPKVSVVLLGLLVVFTEEKFSEHPILTNIMKYAMTSYDPDAAEKIFAEKPVEHDPIGKAAKKAVEEATKRFTESPEYQELQDELAQYAAMQSRRQAYAAAGMTEDVKAVDQEILEAREARRAARVKKMEEEAPPTPTGGEAALPMPEVHHTMGAPRVEPEPFEAPVDEPPQSEVTPEPLEVTPPPKEEEEEDKEPRKRRQQDPAKKLIRDATDLLLTPPGPVKKPQ